MYPGIVAPFPIPNHENVSIIGRSWLLLEQPPRPQVLHQNSSQLRASSVVIGLTATTKHVIQGFAHKSQTIRDLLIRSQQHLYSSAISPLPTKQAQSMEPANVKSKNTSSAPLLLLAASDIQPWSKCWSKAADKPAHGTALPLGVRAGRSHSPFLRRGRKLKSLRRSYPLSQFCRSLI